MPWSFTFFYTLNFFIIKNEKIHTFKPIVKYEGIRKNKNLMSPKLKHYQKLAKMKTTKAVCKEKWIILLHILEMKKIGKLMCKSIQVKRQT